MNRLGSKTKKATTKAVGGRRGAQSDFFAPGSEFRPGKTFGGSQANGKPVAGNPRSARPFSAKRSIHLVMKSKHAVGRRSMRHKQNRTAIDSYVAKQARETGIKLHRYVNVGNHLHLVLQAESRRAYNRFIRAISGRIARIVLKAEKANPIIGRSSESEVEHSRPFKFWDSRPFTRIVEWGRDFTRLMRYTLKNELEAVGFTSAPARYYAALLDAGLAPPRSG